jgi:hypothetical protein
VVLFSVAVAACGGGKTFVDRKDGAAGTSGAAGADGGVDSPVSQPDGETPPTDGPIGTPDVSDDSVPSCGAGAHLCAGACVSDDDFKTCGASCSRCPEPQGGTATCVNKQCDGTCPTGKKLCKSACIDTGAPCDGACPANTHACGQLCSSNTEVTSCGTLCTACPVPNGATQATCDGTKCDFTCGTGYHKCGQTCARDDAAGACGATCMNCPASANGTPICVSGNCSLQCGTGYHLCNDKCLSNTDVGSCGSSCTPCAVPTGGQATCTNGSCGGTCPSGKQLCQGACIDAGLACNNQCPTGSHNCNGLCSQNNSTNSCGTTSCTACPLPTGANQATCDGTSCGFTCGTGYHKCGTGCSADSDANACGASCTKCPTDANGTAVCSNGACGIMCKNGFHRCPAGTGACVSNALTSSCGTTSCTACPVPTGGNATCDGLSCGSTCPSGQQLCAGACIAANLACNGTCPTGTHNCNGICSSDTAAATCGTRCTACPAPVSNGAGACTGGTCTYACNSGYKLCPGTAQCVPSTAPAGCCSNTDCPATAPLCTNYTCVGRPLGNACTTQAECASGKCAEGVCCSEVCNTTCKSCLAANTGVTTGTCANVKVNTAHGSDCATQAASTCGTTGKCDGAGACSKWPAATVCLAQSCPAGGVTETSASTCNGSGTCVAGTASSCGVYKCDASTMSCKESCTANTDCATNYTCLGGVCAKKPNGTPCAAAAECTSNVCGGRCCPVGTACNCPQPSAGNLLTNPGFETTAGRSGWTPMGGNTDAYASVDPFDAHGCPYSSSLKLYTYLASYPPSLTQCVPVSASKTYNFGAMIYDQYCYGVFCELHWFNGASCGNVEVGSELIQSTATAWTAATAGPLTPPSDAVSARVICRSNGPAPGGGADCWAYIDEVYLTPAPGKY